MSGAVIHFPGRRRGGHALPPSCSRAWAQQHGPLVDAALDLGQADEAEFSRRCSAIVEAEGRGVLEQLVAQVDRAGEHFRRLACTLSLVAMRLRTTLATDDVR